MEALYSFFTDVKRLSSDIEVKFYERKSYGELDRIIFHLYSRSKREYEVSELLLNSKIRANFHLEVIPHLRSLLETYFHIRYIYVNKEKPLKVLDSYTHYERYQYKRIVSNVNELIRETKIKENIDTRPMYSEFLGGHKKTRYDKGIIGSLMDIKQLSKDVKSYKYYVEIYNILSSYTHFNTSTYAQFGSVDEDTFVFNKVKHNVEVEKIILEHLHAVYLGFLKSIIGLLSLEEVETKYLEVEDKWKNEVFVI